MKTQTMLFKEGALEKEIFFKMSCSSGKGGQNVNRVATKATLFFHLAKSQLFEEELKTQLLAKLANKITKDGFLVIYSQNHRTALKNRKEAISKLKLLLQNAAQQKKKRKPSRTPAVVHRKRLADKKQQSHKKSLRRKVNGNSAIGLF